MLSSLYSILVYLSQQEVVSHLHPLNESRVLDSPEIEFGENTGSVLCCSRADKTKNDV